MPQRYFVENIKDYQIVGQDAHHIKRVMRMQIGDSIIVCSQKQCFLSTITSMDDNITFQIEKEIKGIHLLDVTLIQGLPKHPKNEFVVKYGTMFGASSIIFVEMDRSISKLENQSNKLQRLNLIAKEAAELSHLSYLPQIFMEKDLSKIDYTSYDLVLLADEQEEHHQLISIDIKPHLNQKIAVIIGPEGGISDRERKMLKEEKIQSISLGKKILPTEAACLYVLSHLAREID